jgi:hypothetical protein
MSQRLVITWCSFGLLFAASGAAAGGPPWKGGPGGPGIQVPAIGAGTAFSSPNTPVVALPAAVPAGATPVTQNRSPSGGAIVSPPGLGASKSRSHGSSPSMPQATSAPASGDAGSAVSGGMGGMANGSASGEGGSPSSPGAPTNVAALEQSVIAATQQNERDVRQLPTCR